MRVTRLFHFILRVSIILVIYCEEFCGIKYFFKQFSFTVTGFEEATHYRRVRVIFWKADICMLCFIGSFHHIFITGVATVAVSCPMCIFFRFLVCMR